jgi:predicted aldo/keto reductase-like oxidoreductase
MQGINRRDFLKSSLAAVAGAALSSCAGGKQEKVERAPGKQERKYPVVKRTLGRTGIEIPIISMGGGAEDRAVYAAALKAGITYIDTDTFYLHGRHEKLVGEVIKGHPRESLVVATRINVPADQITGLYRNGTRGDDLLEPFEASMKRLGVGYLDILSLHSVSAAAAATYGPILETLKKIKASGRARFLGLSVHGYEPDVMRAAVDCGAYDVIIVSYNFKQNHAAEIKEAIAYAAGAGLGIIAMKTQAGAFLDRERTKPINHKAAIKWVLSDTNVHTAIPGFRSFEEMELFLSVMGDLTLTSEEQADLDSARLHAGLYCQSCGRCVPQCTHGVFVPAYMRAFMYAYGYRKPDKAKETIAQAAPERLPCGDCASCRVTCVMGFDVKRRILDIARVRDVPGEFLRA